MTLDFPREIIVLAPTALVWFALFLTKASSFNTLNPILALEDLVVACTFFLSMMTFENHGIAFVFLLLAGILIDAGVSANLVFSQKVVFSLAPEIRSRLNAMFVASIFTGGAIGSALGAYAYAQWGWATTAAVGGVIPCMGLILFCISEKKAGLQSA